MKLDAQQEQHRDALAKMVLEFKGYIEEGIELINNAELKPKFQDNFRDDIALRLDSTVAEIQGITHTDTTWRRLDEVGLVGQSGELKVVTWNWFASHPQTGNWRPWWLDKVFKLMNSLLGSLAKVIPGVEGIKEYKDAVEVVIDYQNRPQEPPQGILG